MVYFGFSKKSSTLQSNLSNESIPSGKFVRDATRTVSPKDLKKLESKLEESVGKIKGMLIYITVCSFENFN